MKAKQNYTAERFETVKEICRWSAERYFDKTMFLCKCKGMYQPMSYEWFGNWMNALGTALMEEGFSGRHILLLGDPTPEWAMTYLTVVSGVGVAVPVESGVSSKELAAIAAFSDATAVIYPKKQAQALSDLKGDFLCLSFEELESRAAKGELFLMGGNRSFLDAEPKGEELCTLSVTRDGKGKYHGVMLSQRNICFAVFEMSKTVYLTDGDVVLSAAPVSPLCRIVCGLLAPVYRGAAVAFSQEMGELTREMRGVRPTVMLATPVLIQRMYESLQANVRRLGLEKHVTRGEKIGNLLPFEGQKREAVRRILPEVHGIFGGRMRMLISAMAPVEVQAAEGFARLGISVLQGYGLTESTCLMALNRDRACLADSVGGTLPDTILDIDDPRNEGVGEVRCQGDHVMMGYYKEPSLTAKIIRGGWLYTGMIGRIDREGDLHLIGRKQDRIVTKKGDVYPQLIEELICKNPFVLSAVVVGYRQKVKDAPRIVAVLCPDQGRMERTWGRGYSPRTVELEMQKAVADANAKLKAYQRVEEHLIHYAELPRTPSGQLQRDQIADYAARFCSPKKQKKRLFRF